MSGPGFLDVHYLIDIMLSNLRATARGGPEPLVSKGFRPVLEEETTLYVLPIGMNNQGKHTNR